MNRLFKINESEKGRILNMHQSATSRQYLNEQESDILSSNQMAEIAKRLTNLLVGDVRTKHLEQVFEILKNEVFGKKASESECAYSKVSKYFEGTRAKFFTWGAFVPSDYKKTELYAKINQSEEGGEPQFQDVKKQLMDAINAELNGFCKRLAEQSKQSSEQQEIKDEFYKKFPCSNTPEYENPSFIVSNGKKFMKFKNNGKSYAVRYDDGLVFMWDGKTYTKTEVYAKCEGSSTGGQSNSGLNEEFAKLPGQDDQPQDNQQQDNQQQTNQNTQQQQTGQQKGGQKLLKKGVKDDEVLSVKQKINKALPNVIQDLGINVSDNTYDPKTVAAVAYFQAKNNLKVDGIVGPETRGALSKISS
jgi:hypothetical protein